jgi:cold shock CspA family protein
MNDAIRYEGRLVMWNLERGFGAILPSQGGQELFVHVSAFPNDGPPPSVDEFLSFEIVSDGDGRKRAARVTRAQRRSSEREDMKRVLAPSTGAAALRRRREERRRRITYALVGVTLAVAALSWLQFSRPHADMMAAQSLGTHVH